MAVRGEGESPEDALLVKFADEVLHGTAVRPANWAYTLGDGEASFWMR